MTFESWWVLNKACCEGQPARQVALRAWSAVKAYHRIPSEGKEAKADSGSEAMSLISEILKKARERGFSYDEQIELWFIFLCAVAEQSALVDQLGREHSISRPEAVELAFKQRPIGLEELMRKVNPSKADHEQT